MKTYESSVECLFGPHFKRIYGGERVEECVDRMNSLLRKYDLNVTKEIDVADLWTHQDHILITYADKIQSGYSNPKSHIETLHAFLMEYLSELVSTVHLLPFFPSSSDDGFSVINYRQVDEQIGTWDDIEKLDSDFRLMADLVVNHTSRYSEWFRKFIEREAPYDDYFIEVERRTDLSRVTRPRSSPLCTQVQTKSGETLVWTTFSEDQIDVNFANPDVLFEYLDIFLFYLSEGVRVVRLDAVAFLWKEIGTDCIHLPETHEVIKLFRKIVDHYHSDVTLITETNVPHKENISYFGDGDEAHMVYQFSLPPLLLHALLTENASYLTEWADSLTTLPEGCTYFNFTSSHDGIGVRPLEGLVPDHEFKALVDEVEERGGYVSYREKADSTTSPYELNITYFDAFKDRNGSTSFQEKRYFCSQLIMLSLQGVPGIYFHNLTGTSNYHEGVRETGRYRTINRKKWQFDELKKQLSDSGSKTRRVFYHYCELIQKRRQLAAFHPFGSQKVYRLNRDLFCIERTAPDESTSVLVVCNVTAKEIRMDIQPTELPLKTDGSYTDELSGEIRIEDGLLTLQPFDVIWIHQ